MSDPNNLCHVSVLEKKRLFTAVIESIGPKIGPTRVF